MGRSGEGSRPAESGRPRRRRRKRSATAPALGAIRRDPARSGAIRLERRREVVFAGRRWFDLARRGTLDAAAWAGQAESGDAARGAPGVLLPIPRRELGLNASPTQNPGG